MKDGGSKTGWEALATTRLPLSGSGEGWHSSPWVPQPEWESLPHCLVNRKPRLTGPHFHVHPGNPERPSHQALSLWET